MTGPAAEIGNSILEGIKIAHELDSHDRFEIKLIIEDDKLDPKTSINITNKLISIDKVNAIIGLAPSSIALAVAPIGNKNKTLMLSATASSPDLTNAGEYFFRIYPSDYYDGKVLADFSFDNLNAKTASVLFLNNDFGVGLTNSFVINFQNNGGVIIKKEGFSPNSTNFRTQLLSIKQSKSDVLLIIAIDTQYENIIRQFREMDIHSKIIAPVTFDNVEMIERLGNAANGIFFTRPFYDIQSNDSIFQLFRNEFSQLYNREPSLLNALGFDNYYILIESLKNVNYSFEKARGYMLNNSFVGASGKMQFDNNGDVIKEIEIMSIQEKKITKYEK